MFTQLYQSFRSMRFFIFLIEVVFVWMNALWFSFQWVNRKEFFKTKRYSSSPIIYSCACISMNYNSMLCQNIWSQILFFIIERDKSKTIFFFFFFFGSVINRWYVAVVIIWIRVLMRKEKWLYNMCWKAQCWKAFSLFWNEHSIYVSFTYDLIRQQIDDWKLVRCIKSTINALNYWVKIKIWMKI